MAQPPKSDDRTLRALERSRSVAFEEASAATHVRVRELAEREAAHADAVSACEKACQTQRDQLAGATAVTAEQLLWAQRYVAAQLVRERQERAAREVADELLCKAQEEARQRLKELRIVERLRARRREEFLKQRVRESQLRLDELGLIKAVSDHGKRATHSMEEPCQSAE